jgi:hypothetical protein
MLAEPNTPNRRKGHLLASHGSRQVGLIRLGGPVPLLGEMLCTFNTQRRSKVNRLPTAQRGGRSIRTMSEFSR